MFSHIDAVLNDLVHQLPAGGEGYLTPDQAEYMYAFIRLTKPRIVAETGFNAGHSACVILRAMESYGGGTLLSFDIGNHDVTQKAGEIVKKRYEHFHLVLGDSKETLASTLAQSLSSNNDATLDLAIVDGGHDLQTARHDLAVFEALVKPGGFIWLDDFENRNCIAVGVNMVGREFAAHRPSCQRFITSDNRGMMIFQKGF